MCALLFFLMIAVDRFLDWLNEKWNTHFGGDKVDDDPEDPAALVGSFKRYKWFFKVLHAHSEFVLASFCFDEPWWISKGDQFF